MTWEYTSKLLVLLPFFLANRNIAEIVLCILPALGLYGLLRKLYAVRNERRTDDRGPEAPAVSVFCFLWFLACAAVFVRLAAGLCISVFWHDAPVSILCPAVLAVSLFAGVLRRQSFRPKVFQAAGSLFWLAAGLTAFAMIYTLRDQILPAILAVRPETGLDPLFAAVCGGGYEIFSCFAGIFVWQLTEKAEISQKRRACKSRSSENRAAHRKTAAGLIRFAAAAGILLAELIVFREVPGYRLPDFPVPAAAERLLKADGYGFPGALFPSLLLLAGMTVLIADSLEGLKRTGLRLSETVSKSVPQRAGLEAQKKIRIASEGIRIAILILVCLAAAGFQENLSAVSFFRAFLMHLLTPVLCFFLLLSGRTAALYRRFCLR